MKYVLAIVLIVILSLGFWFAYKSSSTDTKRVAKFTKNEVSIRDMTFNPYEMTVKKGTTVEFINNDNVDHTVTADNSSFDSGELAPGEHYRHTFQKEDVVGYHCQLHPQMTGTIVVQ